MSSNQKPPAKLQAPNEPFKRAVAGCMRSLAKMPAIEVAFTAERPSLVWTGASAKAGLPEPSRRLDAREAAILRGHADSMALRLACHSKDVHRRLTPPAPAARAVFDAVEHARVEAIGSRRMLGVAGNLDAMLDDRFQRARYADIAVRAEAPLEDALAMIVREVDWAQAAEECAKDRRSLAPMGGGTRHRRSRQAWADDRGSAGLRVRRPQAVDGARND